MAFFPIDQTSRFGRNIVTISRLTHQDKVAVDLEVARVTEMPDDAAVQLNYGTTLTKAQLLANLTALQARLTHASVDNFMYQVG